MKGREAFNKDELIQIWIVHNIQIIGEAVANLSNYIKDKYTDIPWNQIVAMRNILVHQYSAVDLSRVWRVVESNLPEVNVKIKDILNELNQT